MRPTHVGFVRFRSPIATRFPLSLAAVSPFWNDLLLLHPEYWTEWATQQPCSNHSATLEGIIASERQPICNQNGEKIDPTPTPSQASSLVLCSNQIASSESMAQWMSVSKRPTVKISRLATFSSSTWYPSSISLVQWINNLRRQSGESVSRKLLNIGLDI